MWWWEWEWEWDQEDLSFAGALAALPYQKSGLLWAIPRMNTVVPKITPKSHNDHPS